MASKQQNEASTEDVAELLDTVDKTLERLKTLYEQYFLGIQKSPPTFIHSDVERKLRDLTQLQLRNTGLRYRLATLQQKFGAYNSYWRRTLRQIENGTYMRNLSKIGREAIRTGAEIPEEILAAMPKRMREQIQRDREQALAIAKRRSKPTTNSNVLPPEPTDELVAMIKEPTELRRSLRMQNGAHVLDERDAEIDIDAFFEAVQNGTIPPPFGTALADIAKLASATARAAEPAAGAPPLNAHPRAATATPPPPNAHPRAATATPPPPPPNAYPRAATATPPSPPARAASSPGIVRNPTGPSPAVPPERPATGPERPATGPERPATGPERPATGPERPAAIPQSARQTGAQPAIPAIVRPTTGSQPAIPRPTTGSQPAIPRPTTGSQPAIVRPTTGSQPAIPHPPMDGPPAIPSIPVTGAQPVIPAAARSATDPHGVPAIPRVAPSQASRPNPIAPGSAAAHGDVEVESMAGPFPRDCVTPPLGVPVVKRAETPPHGVPALAKRPPAPAPARPPPGMTDADVNALYAKYVKAKEMVGEKVGPGEHSKLLKTINQQAPKIMEQYKAKAVDFSVVVKDNQVIIRAKPKT